LPWFSVSYGLNAKKIKKDVANGWGFCIVVSL